MHSIEEQLGSITARVATTNEALMGVTSVAHNARTPKKRVIEDVLRLRDKLVEAVREERLENAKLGELRVQQIEQLRKEKEALEREREQRLGTYGPLLQGEGLDKVKQKLRAVGESIARGDERPKQATQDLFNSVYALIGGLTPEGAGKGVPLADRLCAIAEAIHGVGMFLVNMPPAAPGEHLTDVQMAKLAGKIAAVRTALGEHPLLDRLELLGAMLAQKGNPEGKLVFLLEVVTETLAAEAGVRRMLRKNAALIDGASFTRNAFASLGGPRECRECGKAGDSDLDIVHSRACSYAAMRAFIGFPVLQEEG